MAGGSPVSARNLARPPSVGDGIVMLPPPPVIGVGMAMYSEAGLGHHHHLAHRGVLGVSIMKGVEPAGLGLAWHGYVGAWWEDPCGGGGTGSGLGIGIGELDEMTGGICAGVEGPPPCCGGCCCGGASCASVSQRKQACRVTH